MGINGFGMVHHKKFRIRETSNLLTDADRSTNTTVGWTKNTQKPKKKLKTEINNQKQKKIKISRDMPKLAIYPLTRGLLPIGKRGFHHVL